MDGCTESSSKHLIPISAGRSNLIGNPPALRASSNVQPGTSCTPGWTLCDMQWTTCGIDFSQQICTNRCYNEPEFTGIIRHYARIPSHPLRLLLNTRKDSLQVDSFLRFFSSRLLLDFLDFFCLGSSSTSISPPSCDECFLDFFRGTPGSPSV